MALTEFKIDKIRDLDGGIPAATIDNAVRSAVKDCVSRPRLKKARKVTISLLVVPEDDEDGMRRDVQIFADCSVSLPKAKSQPTKMRPNHDGKLLFNPASPSAPDQGTLDEVVDQENE